MPKTEKIYKELKAIRITPNQAKNWNTEGIRDFLDGKFANSSSPSDKLLLKQLFTLMDSKMTFTKTPSEEDKELIKKVV